MEKFNKFIFCENDKPFKVIIDTDPGVTVFDLGEEYEIDPEEFISFGRATPFKGTKVFGRCLATFFDGKAVYVDKKLMDI